MRFYFTMRNISSGMPKSLCFQRISRFACLFLFSICLLLSTSGCGEDTPADVPFDQVEAEITFGRFDLAMRQASQDFVHNAVADSFEVYSKYLQPEKSFLADWLYNGSLDGISDTIIASDMRLFLSDSLTLWLLDTIHTVFGDNYDFQTALEKPLKRWAYYFPEQPVRKVNTYVTGYSNTGQGTIDQIFVSPTHIGIGLHYFMGVDFPAYPADIPVYMRRKFNPDLLAPMVIENLTDQLIPQVIVGKSPVLLDYMIQAGVATYIKEKMLPGTPDSILLNYTSTQMLWADSWEGRAYKDILKDIYSSDPMVLRRYVQESPYTTTLSRESAPRIGQYLGWKIVHGWMKKYPNTPLSTLAAQRDYAKLFREAGYRPPKDEE